MGLDSLGASPKLRVLIIQVTILGCLHKALQKTSMMLILDLGSRNSRNGRFHFSTHSCLLDRESVSRVRSHEDLRVQVSIFPRQTDLRDREYSTAYRRCTCDSGSVIRSTRPALDFELQAGHITNAKVLMVSDWLLMRKASWLSVRACCLIYPRPIDSDADSTRCHEK